MKISNGKIVEATNNELIDHWAKHWSTFYSYTEYRAMCEMKGTKIIPEGAKKMTINEFFEQLLALYKQKNAAYGGSVHDTYKDYGVVSYIVRMTDKANRIKTLTANHDISCGDEAIKDTWADLASYALLCAADIYCEPMNGIYPEDRVQEYMATLAHEDQEDIKDMAIAFVNGYERAGRFDLPFALNTIYQDSEGPAVYVMLAAYAAVQYINEVNK